MLPCAGSGSSTWDADRLRAATDAAGMALWSWNVDTDELALDERASVLWDMPSDRSITFEELSRRIHPSDLDRVANAVRQTRARPGAYEIDFRILHDGAVRWICSRGQGEGSGIVGRIMFGVFLDVTERKRTEEARDLLAGEMTHRVKNLFAVASALTGIAARTAATTSEMAHDLTQRLVSLGRAHELVRIMPGAAGQALLGDLLAVLLAPYDDRSSAGDRVHIRVPEIRVGEAATTTLALVMHELATNSIKYGALSMGSGTLDVSGRLHGNELEIVWAERGGPRLSDQPRPDGYGSKLIARSLSGQLGGSIGVDWRPEGAVISLRMNRTQLGT